MKKLYFIFLYLIIFQPHFANSEEEVNLKCTGKIDEVNGQPHDENTVVSLIYNKKLKKIVLDGFPIGGVTSHNGLEGYRFPYPTDKNDQERYDNPSYYDTENFTYSWCFDNPSKPELECEYKYTKNSEIKKSITLYLDRISGKLFFIDFKDFLGKKTEIGFLGYCEKVDKLF